MKKHIALALGLIVNAAVYAQEEVIVTDEGTVVTTSVNDEKPEEQQPAIITQSFGYLSYDEALKAMPEYQQAMDALNLLKQTYDAELERAEGEFSKKFSEYVDGHQTFPDNIMLKRQKELQQLMEQSIAFKNEAKDLLSKKEAELMAPLHERLTAVLRALGTERNYAYILNTDANAYPFISTTQGHGEDISAIVKERLNAQ